MEIKLLRSILVCCICATAVSCSVNRTNNESPPGDMPEDIVRLSPEQLAQADIQTGRIEKHMISDIVYCNGTVEADPNHQAYVSAPMNGYLVKIFVHIGEYVRKGQPLAMLEHPGYIDLQREFLEAKSEYSYYREDFKRQGELSLENATSLKRMQEAQREFSKVEARYFALKEHLEFIGINTDSLFVDQIRSTILMKSPITGYITKAEGKIGQLCTPDDPVFQVVGNTGALLHLKVFESDAWKIRKGQEIGFSTIYDPVNNYKAVVSTAAKSVDENNVIGLHAEILNMDKNLLPGMYVKAKILVEADSVYAIDNLAIAKNNESDIIFIKTDSSSFVPKTIKTGRTNDDISEILSVDPELLKAEVVISGAYYLQSELTKEE